MFYFCSILTPLTKAEVDELFHPIFPLTKSKNRQQIR